MPDMVDGLMDSAGWQLCGVYEKAGLDAMLDVIRG
jgi:hypothetical protein